MRDRRADLGLDVVADDREAALLELLLEVTALGDEDRHAVHHRAAGVQDLFGVPLRRLLRTDREEADDDVRSGLLENADDVVGVAGSLLDDLRQVLADPVVRHPARDLDARLRLRDVGELVRVVGLGPDRLGEVLPDLGGRDVESGRELDVPDVVAAEVDVHQAGDELVLGRVLVVLDALDEGVGAVADADDRDADLSSLRAELPFLEGMRSFLREGPAAPSRSPRISTIRSFGPRPRSEARVCSLRAAGIRRRTSPFAFGGAPLRPLGSKELRSEPRGCRRRCR